jgi:hypothetical protein
VNHLELAQTPEYFLGVVIAPGLPTLYLPERSGLPKAAEEAVGLLIDHDHPAAADRVEQQLMLSVEWHLHNVPAADPAARIGQAGRRHDGLSRQAPVVAYRAGTVLAAVERKLLRVGQIEGGEHGSPTLPLY